MKAIFTLAVIGVLGFTSCNNNVMENSVVNEEGTRTFFANYTNTADQFEDDDNYWNARMLTVNGINGAGNEFRNFYDDATDWAKFEAEKGKVYFIQTWVYGDTDTVMYLYNSSNPNVEIAMNDDKYYNPYDDGSRIVLECEESGTYLVKIASKYDVTGLNQGYVLAVTDRTLVRDNYEENDFAEMAYKLYVFEPGSTGSHSMNFADDYTDWVKFDVVANKEVVFETVCNGATDTVLNMYDAAGNFIAYDRYSGAQGAKIVYTPAAAGQLYVRITSAYQAVSSDLTYDVKVTQ